MDLLVLGLGNALCGDDGLGGAVILALERGYDAPPGAQVLDGGTLGLSLLPFVEEARELILVDAVRTGDPPGSLVRLRGEDVAPAVAQRLSVHQIGVADLLDAAHWRGRSPQTLVLLGLAPDRLDWGVGLSPAVAEALPRLLDLVLEEARGLGHEFRAKALDATPLDSRRDPLAELRWL
jgi:hydrogenase maturation protease